MTLHIVNHNVHRVLINIGSSVDVLFLSAYDHIGLPSTVLKLVDTPFYRFSGHMYNLTKGLSSL